MALIGIDLGTTNSMAAVWTPDGPALVPGSGGELTTPSVVGVDQNGNLTVGEAARHRLVTDPFGTASLFKRNMGSGKAFELGGHTLRPEDLSALVLRKLREDAEEHLGETVTQAVISVPAYFNDVQRKATFDAARIADVPVARLVNEPTAAALAYGIREESSDDVTYLIADLGGGTFDVSILHAYHGVLEVRASAGDAYFGGEDFTDAIASHFLHQLDIHPTRGDAGVRAHIRELSERVKRHLSNAESLTATAQLPDGERTLHMTRAELERVCKPLVTKLRLPLQRAMSDAGLKASDLDKVLLVGGATRMPIIAENVASILECEPECHINPVHVVALGASVQSALVARHEALEDVVMTDVCPFTLGVEVSLQVGLSDYRPGYFQPIIERNTTVPVSRVERSQATRVGQPTMTVKVYQGESPRVEDNVFLGQLEIPLPTNNPEPEMVDIRYTFDISALLEVEVTVLSTGRTHRTVIQGQSEPMSQEEIDARLASIAVLKCHPAGYARNVEVVERLKSAYAFHLGEARAAVQDQLDVFQTVLARQNPSEIDIVRREAEEMLDYLDAQKVN